MTWVADPGRERVRLLSLPLARLGGIRLRVHWLFIAYAVVVLLRSWIGGQATADGATSPAGPRIAVMALVSLAVLVTARELVRSLVVRMSGGSAEEVELWPMGALRGLESAPGWRPALAAAAAGPATSAAILALAAMPLGLATGEWLGVALPNPVNDSWLSNPHPAWLECLWVFQRTGVQLALLSLLPLLPLDGGLALSSGVMRILGPDEAPRTAASLSAVASALVAGMAIMAPMPERGTVLAVAIVCFVEAVLALRRVQLGDALREAGGWIPEAPERNEQELKREAAETDAKELDRILEKIIAHGIESLTAREHKSLKRATDRRRQGSDGADR